MSELLDRCAVAFVLDLPGGFEPVSAELAELAARFRAPTDDWRTQLLEELRNLSEDRLAELDAEFTLRFGPDVLKAAEEPARIGGEDHFLFEHRLRRTLACEALVSMDTDALALGLTPFTGTRSPLFRTSGRSATDIQWTFIELLGEAIRRSSAEHYDAAVSARRRLTSGRRPAVEPLGDLFRHAKTVIGPRETTAATAPDPTELRLIELPPVLGVVPLVAPAGGPVEAGDLVLVRPVDPLADLVFLVDPQTGAAVPTTSVPASGVLSVLVAALSDRSPTVAVEVTVRRGGAVVATARHNTPARRLGAVSLWSGNPGTGTVGTGTPGQPAAAAPGSPIAQVQSSGDAANAARAASLTSDPGLQKALEMFFHYDAISDNDLFGLGGASLMRRWGGAIEDLARRGEFRVAMTVGREGKSYRVG